MPVLKNARHEQFAQELAKGCTADEAYQLAGYSENRGNATRMKANESVAARVAEILAASAKTVEDEIALSRNDIIRMLIDDRKLARDNTQSAAAMKAAELIGRELHQMFIDRKEVGKPGEFASLSAEGLRAAIAERLGVAGPGERASVVPRTEGSNGSKPSRVH